MCLYIFSINATLTPMQALLTLTKTMEWKHIYKFLRYFATKKLINWQMRVKIKNKVFGK